MSRQAKASQHSILTSLPPKPRQTWAMVGTEGIKRPVKTTKTQKLSKQSTVAGSDLHNTYNPSKIQFRVAQRIGRVYRHLKSSERSNLAKPQVLRPVPVTPAPETPTSAFTSFSSYCRVKGLKSNKSITVPSKSHKGSGEGRFGVLLSTKPEAISIEDYVHRFFDFGEICDEVCLLAYIYFQRALRKQPELGAGHIHKLVSGCVLLASKYLIEGTFWRLEDFSNLSCVLPTQMKKIEKCVLLEVLGFELYVSEEELVERKQRLLSGCF